MGKHVLSPAATACDSCGTYIQSGWFVDSGTGRVECDECASYTFHTRELDLQAESIGMDIPFLRPESAPMDLPGWETPAESWARQDEMDRKFLGECTRQIAGRVGWSRVGALSLWLEAVCETATEKIPFRERYTLLRDHSSVLGALTIAYLVG